MKRSTRDRWWVGIPLIAIGAMILFRQLGYDIDVGYIFRTYWPLFLIWWGPKEYPRFVATGLRLYWTGNCTGDRWLLSCP